MEIEDHHDLDDFITQYGILSIRGCEVVEQLDEKYQKISQKDEDKKIISEGNKRKLNVYLDCYQYKKDVEDPCIN